MIRLGALEAGGTKMVCAVCDEDGHVLEKSTFPTTTPQETLPKLLDYFKQKEITSLGIGCFGPIDRNVGSITYGSILNTPKLAWKNCRIVDIFASGLQLPIGFDTDVNASMLAEASFGNARDVRHAIYITIGTGIGVGILANGQLLHGMLHPEAGHILLNRHKKDVFSGNCPYHVNCLEGLASGAAMEKRYGVPAGQLANQKEVWELEADYIAQALMNYILILSPQRVILGGGVMHQRQLYPLIRKKLKQYINGYILTPELADLKHYIVEPGLSEDSGIIGAALLGWKKRNGDL